MDRSRSRVWFQLSVPLPCPKPRPWPWFVLWSTVWFLTWSPTWPMPWSPPCSLPWTPPAPAASSISIDPVLWVDGKNREVSSTAFVVPEIGGPEIDPTSDPGANRAVVEVVVVVVVATDGPSIVLTGEAVVERRIGGRGLGVVPAVTTNPLPGS